MNRGARQATVHGVAELDTTEQLTFSLSLFFPRELTHLYKIKPVNPKGNQPRIFTGRTDGKAEAPVLWSPAGNN